MLAIISVSASIHPPQTHSSPNIETTFLYLAYKKRSEHKEKWLPTTLFIIASLSFIAHTTAITEKNKQYHGHLIPARATKTIHNCYSASLQRKQFFSNKKKSKKHHSTSSLSDHPHPHPHQRKRSLEKRSKIETLYICTTTKKNHSSTVHVKQHDKLPHKKHKKHKKSSASKHHHEKHRKHGSSNEKNHQKAKEDAHKKSGTKNFAAKKKHKDRTKLTVHYGKSLSVTKTNKKFHKFRETSTTTHPTEPTVLPYSMGTMNPQKEKDGEKDTYSVQDKKQETVVNSSVSNDDSDNDSNSDITQSQPTTKEDNSVNETEQEDEDGADDTDTEDDFATDSVAPSSIDLVSVPLPTSPVNAPIPPVDNNNQVTAQTVQNGQAVDNEPQNKIIGVSVGAVVGCLAAAGLAGMFIYKRKQKSDQDQTSDFNRHSSGGWGSNGGDMEEATRVNTRWRTQSFLAVVTGAVAKLPAQRSNSSSSSRSGGSFLGSIRRAASQASRSLSVRSNNASLKRSSSGNSSVQSYGIAVSGPMPSIVRVDGDQAHYYTESNSPSLSSAHGSPPEQYNQVYHTHAY
ncbi:hypothetical protein BDF20DRAFT_838902 [Mycotypha africana]|uniref:uncharacterized protein n=1 Tax=Mycotypha africana TaxID=64632 RepID=UPI002301C66C|nr:uncharacterized protein BDF20DRAFT_838902 [Mycotypha africana]KAI8968913.1 hypothetical protein BDF20DRAFT_838902 [Mycotypha africana]